MTRLTTDLFNWIALLETLFDWYAGINLLSETQLNIMLQNSSKL